MALRSGGNFSTNDDMKTELQHSTSGHSKRFAPPDAKHLLPPAKIHYLHISRSWITRNEDGSIKDFGIRIIKHRESYCQWNDDKKDWDYITVPCNCEICQETKQQPVQLSLFGCR